MTETDGALGYFALPMSVSIDGWVGFQWLERDSLFYMDTCLFSNDRCCLCTFHLVPYWGQLALQGKPAHATARQAWSWKSLQYC